jgi:protein MpaA
MRTLLVGALAAAALAAPQPQFVGRSVLHRAIHVYVVGNPSASHRVLVVGCIHGNEPGGIAIARALDRVTPPRDTALWIVPVLNPDGVAADTRQNAHLVDLNRNFPWRWRDLEGVYDSGPRAASEPETRAAMRLVLRVKPTLSVWYHQHLDVVDESGGNAALERRYARLVGLRPFLLPRYPGSVASWENHVLPHSTAFVVELPAGRPSPAAVARHVRAVLALA